MDREAWWASAVRKTWGAKGIAKAGRPVLGTASPLDLGLKTYSWPGLLEGAFYLPMQGIKSEELGHLRVWENGWDQEDISVANKGLSAGIQAIFGHLIWRANSLEKTLILGINEGRRGERMRWLDGITDSNGWLVFEHTLGNGEEQRSLACCSPRGYKELDTTWRLNIQVIPQDTWPHNQLAAWELTTEKDCVRVTYCQSLALLWYNRWLTPLLPMFPSCFSSSQPSSQATKQQKGGFFKQVSFRSLTHFTPFLPRFLLFLEMGLHDRTIHLYRNQEEHPHTLIFYSWTEVWYIHKWITPMDISSK